MRSEAMKQPGPGQWPPIKVDLQVRPCVYLSRLPIPEPKEVANDFERDAAFQLVHAPRVPQAVGANRLREAGKVRRTV